VNFEKLIPDTALYGSLELNMPREILGKGLRFSLRHAPCAHICRYCLISESRKRSALPFARFEHLVHRFHDWQQSTRRDDLQIRIFVGPLFDVK
jgi:hypothetical protein